MYAEIQIILASVKNALDLAKTAKEFTDFQRVSDAVNEIKVQLLELNMTALAVTEKNSSLVNRVAELEKQIRESNEWLIEIRRYELYEFPVTKALVYIVKENCHNGEPLHYLCATCVSQRKKTILQPNGYLLVCPVCKTNVAVKPAPKPKRQHFTPKRNWLDK